MERHNDRTGGVKSNRAGKKKKPKKYVYNKVRISIVILICLIIVTPLAFRAVIRERDRARDDVLSFDNELMLQELVKKSPAVLPDVTALVMATVMPSFTPDNIAPSNSPSSMPSSTPVSTPSSKPLSTPVSTPTPAPTPDAVNNDLPYYLYFEKGSFTLTIYEKDENGEYTKVYRTYRAAHGGNKTPAGKFEILSRERWHEFPDGGFVQYAVRYHNRLYLHSPLYGAEDPKVLWPMYYDGEHGIGKESTGGCIRMVTEAARFIYENCPDGTVFEIVNGSPKGTTSDPPPDRNGKRVDPTDVNVE